MKIGVIGCARGVAEHMAAAGLDPVAFALSGAEGTRLLSAGIAQVDSYLAFWEHLDHPRVYLLDVAVGAGVDRTIDEAYQFMEPGDIVVDPSGSYWCDTLRRYRRMRHRSLYYIDAAWIRREERSRLLVAGDEKGVRLATPTLEIWAGEAGVAHVGSSGLAHYALMVEDAVLNAQAQIWSEAALMIEAWPSEADEDAIKSLYPLVDRPPLGRAAWQIDDALRLEAATPLLAQATMLNLAEALEEQQLTTPPTRVGPFQHPDEIL